MRARIAGATVALLGAALVATAGAAPGTKPSAKGGSLCKEAVADDLDQPIYSAAAPGVGLLLRLRAQNAVALPHRIPVRAAIGGAEAGAASEGNETGDSEEKFHLDLS